MATSTSHREVHLPHSLRSNHSHMSPTILTPDSDKINTNSSDLIFSKQPIPTRKPSSQPISLLPVSPFSQPINLVPSSQTPDISIGEESDNTSQKQHLSLLTAILSSPEHNQPSTLKTVLPKKNSTTGLINNGILSDKSSNPSTTFNSPQNAPHGILQNPPPALQSRTSVTGVAGSIQPNSILRRGSEAASDLEGIGLGLNLDRRESAPEKILSDASDAKKNDKRGSIGWADQKIAVSEYVHVIRVRLLML